MTDPVRPVAPREDEELAVAMLAACEATIRHLWDIAARFDTKECNMIRDEIHRLNALTLPAIQELRAAAPVPCAASPADELKKRIGALATFPQHVYAHMGDSIGRYIVTVEVGKVFALIDELLPRATGEGARDAVTGLPAVPVPPGAATEELAAVADSVPLSAIRALVQQWEKDAKELPSDMPQPDKLVTVRFAAEWVANVMNAHAAELTALCPAPPEDQQPQR